MTAWLRRRFRKIGARAAELVEKYRPQLMYFDNGVNNRAYDGVKLQIAALLYDRALTWREQATIVSKDRAYLAGSVNTFERPRGRPGGSTQDVAVGRCGQRQLVGSRA